MLKRMSNYLIDAFSPRIPITTGDLHSYVSSTLSTVRVLLFAMMAAILVMTVAYVRVSAKPPVVIRVDTIGNANAVSDYAVNNAVSDVEVNAFAKMFLESIVEVHSFTISKDLARALNMMTKQFQDAHRTKIKNSDYIDKIRKANIKRELHIEKMAVTGNNEYGYEMDIQGILSTKPLNNETAPADRSGLLGQLYLVRVPRSEITPHGLLVSNFQWREVPLEEVIKKDEVKSLKE